MGALMGERSAGLVSTPFWIRRPSLLFEGARVDRDNPDLAKLLALEPEERFVWGVLPHAARSFAPCIISLPAKIALPMAVGYLYCRTLDTYEDLVADPGARRRALLSLPERLERLRGGERAGPAPELLYECLDPRDKAHALLADELSRLDLLFLGFPAPVQEALCDLVSDMSAGMRWAADTFETQGGSLADSAQLSEYCVAVLGNPIRFAARLFQWLSGRGVDLDASVEGAARDVGEFLQLANITRDIEKDLLRGVAYCESLSDSARRRSAGDAALIIAARTALCDRALSLAPAYLELVDGMRLGSGLMSSSALMMLRFTDQHYRRTAARVGVEGGRVLGVSSVIWRSLPGVISGAWARSQMQRSVDGLCALQSDLRAQASSMYLS